jgi:hypothetical protein
LHPLESAAFSRRTPKAEVLAELPYVVFLDQTMRKKLRWKVSVAALNYRGAICPTFLGGARLLRIQDGTLAPIPTRYYRLPGQAGSPVEWNESLKACLSERRNGELGSLTRQEAFSKNKSPLYFIELLKLLQRTGQYDDAEYANIFPAMDVVNRFRIDAHAKGIDDSSYNSLLDAIEHFGEPVCSTAVIHRLDVSYIHWPPRRGSPGSSP